MANPSIATLNLKRLQKQLECIYRVEVDHNVDDFLITDPELARALDTSKGAREVEEKLLVLQEGDNVDLALYLDPSVVNHLAEDDPTKLLHEGNLAQFCTALEGVSHFLYLTWNATYGRSVTLLELELQAEVDKYIASIILIGKQRKKRFPARLRSWLFESVSFDEALCDGDLERYRDANHYAGKYCWHLENRYLRDYRNGSMLKELRQFYRLTLRDKIRRIDFAS